MRKLAVGFSALRRQALPPSASPLVAASLWGSEGFGGGQPVARMLLLAAAASEAGVRLRLLLPRGCEAKWFKGVLAELRAADARGTHLPPSPPALPQTRNISPRAPAYGHWL